jgi:hypothetical protein
VGNSARHGALLGSACCGLSSAYFLPIAFTSRLYLLLNAQQHFAWLITSHASAEPAEEALASSY